jgi:hypothetical protein
MLERLTPVERAVFLLREIFDHKYSEIAAALGLSEANCRQILRRARQHVRAVRPRFRASARESGVVSYYPNGQPHSVLTLDATAGRIRAIYIVTNPEKLSRLPAPRE